MSAEKTGEGAAQVAQGPPDRSSFSSRERVMKCAHLTIARAILSCRALERRYLPSQFELAEYCRTNGHRKCPLYLKGIISTGQAENDSRAAHL